MGYILRRRSGASGNYQNEPRRELRGSLHQEDEALRKYIVELWEDLRISQIHVEQQRSDALTLIETVQSIGRA